MSRAAIALGANLGDRLAALQSAVARMSERVDIVAASRVYETDPVGGPDGQPAFLNAVVTVVTDRQPAELLAWLHAIEAAHHRVRDVRWGPRTLDLDLLAYDQVVSETPELRLPHPRAHERAFVLVPWAEVDPTHRLPGRGTVAELLAALPPADVAEVRRTEGALLSAAVGNAP